MSVVVVFLFILVRPVVDPGHVSNLCLIKLVVSEGNYIQVGGLVENSLRYFLYKVVLQMQLLRKKMVQRDKYNKCWLNRLDSFGSTAVFVCEYVLFFLVSFVCDDNGSGQRTDVIESPR